MILGDILQGGKWNILVSPSETHMWFLVETEKEKGLFKTHTHTHTNFLIAVSVISGRRVCLIRLLVNCICECLQALHIILGAERERDWARDYSPAHAQSCSLPWQCLQLYLV